MDKRHLQPKDRNDRVKLELVRQHAAAQAREGAQQKHNLLRMKVAPFIAQGYRVGDLEMVEQADPIGHRIIGRIDVQLSEQGKLVFAWVLWLRRAWRRTFPYHYAIQADREHSHTEPGRVD